MTFAIEDYETSIEARHKRLNAENLDLRHALDTEKLLRVNDASTIADLQRRLHEAEGQLKAQRKAASGPFGDTVWTDKGIPQWVSTDWANEQFAKLAAENTELRRTISLMAKTAAEVQDNFRLIAELATDPADEKHKEPKP